MRESPSPSRWPRRRFLALAGAAGVTVASGLSAACSPKAKPGKVADDGSVTVQHVFGETKIGGPPRRVVSAGFTGQDDLLALGVVPVAITEWFGDQPFGTWPWAQPRLGSAQPVLLNLADGIQVDQIAACTPDLIIATNAGLDSDTYAKLSAIAPTVAQAGTDAFFEPWTVQASTIGQAVFKYDEMKTLISGVEDGFAGIAKDNPSFNGKSALIVSGTFFRDQAVVTASGWRTEFLTKMGFTIPSSVDSHAHGNEALLSRDDMISVLDAADVLIWTTETDEEQAALLADPTFARLRATKNRRNVFTGKELAGAIAFASVLSYPVVAQRLPPMLTKALA